MASASSKSAKSLFNESKARLADRVQINVNNIASVARQIQRGSKSNEILMHSARNFALQQHALENTDQNIRKLQVNAVQLKLQYEPISKNATLMEELNEQVRSMQR
ncbi:hypothetical protein LSTR_LSTR011459 [Laodelphax striatellus]|uniref:BLOC-1-related complex subunit 7 n=1 Tax=Laodelphax striatellus TaxID=195883 RepID=A0A482WH37_LAOST|nr:hypothetical protein LSTR_LSTR011459 [Laodelphax striatellus]